MWTDMDENEAEDINQQDNDADESNAADELEETRGHTQKRGHGGVFNINPGATMEKITTLRAAFAPPRSPGVRLRGIRSELLERRIAQIMREKIHAERNPPLPQTDFATITQRDFRVDGFIPQTTKITHLHDYKTEQAISYWSENYQQIQGVSAVESPNTPFRKCAQFSTPIEEQREEIELTIE
ncbi:sperm associated antigen 8 isoform X2 [Dunckerocampus dactyliophorus]|uniref:sperm associated antigen 8 isoform X2 n=1 Tax=Dunckerocampus dactyliophorus TaxID=161453 RepID=UPI0024053777|nr:sperm associated antigen 8 isoform X2 [Dunckerocampus dactyliophorus]